MDASSPNSTPSSAQTPAQLVQGLLALQGIAGTHAEFQAVARTLERLAPATEGDAKGRAP